jgi:transcriptional regulator of acetoin/glycerol metabolism
LRNTSCQCMQADRWNILEFVGVSDDSGRVRHSNTRSGSRQNRSLRQAAQQFEKEYLLRQLEACRWYRTQTAKKF